MSTHSNARRVCLIAIGGASSSGKTTLAKHLRLVLPNSFILHQDDFAPPPSKIPLHPKFEVADWDDAPHAIEWDRLRDTLSHLKTMGSLPAGEEVPEEASREAAQSRGRGLIPLSQSLQNKWGAKFHDDTRVFAIVEGFLCYWHPAVDQLFDVRIFMRTEKAIIKERRAGRGGFALNGTGPTTSAEVHGHAPKEGDREFWIDPPWYFDEIVWPHYLEFNGPLFVAGDVERGDIARSDVTLTEGEDVDANFAAACRAIEQTLYPTAD